MPSKLKIKPSRRQTFVGAPFNGQNCKGRSVSKIFFSMSGSVYRKMDVITETSLEALIQRATDPRNKVTDTAAIDAFCGILKKEPDGSYVATRLIASKIQSPQEWEALQGLSLLEACMRNCGPQFQSEIGKFRFLNEMIKLVSPKFLGQRTPVPVRDQVIKLMYTWTINYPRESKIKEAYEMLRKQGVIGQHDSDASADKSKLSTPKKSHPLFQDEEKVRLLQKLLHSKNPDDLQAANRLIKTMVKEDEKRIEIKCKKVTELEAVKNNVRLLSEMLDSYNPGHASSEEIELIKELHLGCMRLRPNVFRIAADTSDNDEMLSHVLAISDELGQVLEKYTSVMILSPKVSKSKSEDSKQVSPLLDFTTPTNENLPQTLTPAPAPALSPPSSAAKNANILNEPLSILDSNLPTNFSKPALANHKIEKTSSNLDVLDELFAPLPQDPKTQTQNPILPLCSSNVNQSKPEDDKGPDKTKVADKKSKTKAFDDLDILGETLMQKCKMDSALSLSKLGESTKTTEKEVKAGDGGPVKSTAETSDDDAMMDLCDATATPNPNAKRAETENTKQEVKPLTDVSVSLESIKPSTIPPITVIEDQNGLSVTLFIAKDTPREDVTVLVITTVSTNPSPITNYLFHAVVPKGCKVKVQPPSGSDLPAHNPFLPPSAITQIMLIANPNKLDVTLKCMISFTVDGETVTELGEVETLPTLT